jgi:cell division septation protein DedD
MRIILWSIISWVALACIAVVVIFSVLTILKMTKEAIRKSGVSRNEFIVSLIISAVFLIVLSFSVFKYFVWKRSANKVSESKSLETSFQKREPIKEIEPHVSTQLEEQVLKETTTEQVESSVGALHEEAVPQGKKKEQEQKKQKKLEPLKSSKAIFTVQTGAFSDFSHAKSLKGRFNKKGYNVYITSSTTAEGKLYRVCIGKFIEREKAKTLSEKIRSSEGLEAFVTSSQP